MQYAIFASRKNQSTPMPSVKYSWLNNKWIILILVLLFTSLIDSQAQNSFSISGDDAKRKEPLKEALQLGSAGVSVKVKLDNEGNLSCGGKSFSDLYLNQLSKVGSRNSPFLIIAEIEGDSSKIISALNAALAPNTDFLYGMQGDEVRKGDVKLILWGDIPFASIKSLPARSYFTLYMMEKGSSKGKADADFLGINFDKLYKWNGRESMPNMQYHGLQTNLKAAHKAGQKTILFDAPETFNAWNILTNAGTDYFVVKDLAKFSKYLKEK
jgi:hypothetical protein